VIVKVENLKVTFNPNNFFLSSCGEFYKN